MYDCQLCSLSSGSSGHAPLTSMLSNKSGAPTPTTNPSLSTPSPLSPNAASSSSQVSSGGSTSGGSIFFSHGGSMKIMPKAPSIKLKRSRSSNNPAAKAGSYSGGSATSGSTHSSAGGACSAMMSPAAMPVPASSGAGHGQSSLPLRCLHLHPCILLMQCTTHPLQSSAHVECHNPSASIHLLACLYPSLRFRFH